MQQLFDKAELQKVQDYFCTLTHLFAYCVGTDGEKMTEMSGDEEGIRTLKAVVSEEDFYQLLKRVSDSSLEDIVVASTAYDNLKLAAVSAQRNGEQNICWLVCCVLEDVTEGKLLQIPCQGIGTDDFYKALDLIAEIEQKAHKAERELLSARVESERSKCSETEMSRALRRTEAMTAMVQFLESDKSFEDMGNEIMKIAGEYLDVSGVKLFQIRRSGERVDMICNWLHEHCVFDLDRTRDLPRTDLLMGEKPLVLSSDALTSAGIRGEMLKFRMKAFISMPIFVNGKPAMYLCVNEQEKARTWQLDEIKFVNDAAKVLQSLLNKRIQKNSLAGSYASLQEILDNVGTCIYVKDSETGKCLFANKLLKRTFELELQKGTLDMILANAKPLGVKEGFYEIDHKDRGRWYDLYHVQIGWIDGRKVDLYALYDITDKKIYQAKIEQQAYTDFLTGLYNRMCCERDLAVQIDKAKKQHMQGGLLYMDLDDFKHINDGLGHQYGDVLLQSISHAFQRVEGISESCYRMGGDEFVMIVPPESFEQLDRIIEDIQAIFSKPWYLKDADYYCTMSMGVCTYPEDGESVADLIKKADIAMYEAKRKGKNRIARYSSGLNSVSNKRLDMEKNMRDATSDNCNEFRVYFQPIIDIQKPGTPCVGAEALVRWNSAALGFIPPADFIPLAEYLGLITPIGNYVLREACYACKKWNDNGYPNYKVNVNLSVVQLLQSDITDVVKLALKDTGINPHNLTLEVTESLAINDMKRMKIILNDIRKLGVRIALDDFGTGYSSLNHIREIPLDVIKVDQSFVKDLAEDEYSQSFIKMVAELASAIDVSICVEGIETKEQYKVLEGMKVRLVQGYYFDKPLPREEFELKYAK
jgi:diguanylate cyclase (GGDEF)-like protein